MLLVGTTLVALQAANAFGQTAYTVTVTIQGLPGNSSTNLYVDGIVNGTLSGGQSRSFSFPLASTHVITVDFYVPNSTGTSGTRYYEKDTSWGFAGGGSHIFAYATQYYLTVDTSYGTAKGENWYDSGTSAQAVLNESQILESPGVQHVFTGWGGDASGTGLTSSSIMMDRPKTATANWKTQFQLTVQADPPSVSGLNGSGWYDAGSQVSFSAPAIVPANKDSRLRFDHWTGYDGQSTSGTILMDRPKVVQAHYIAQYLLTIIYDPATIPHSYNETSWYDASTNVPLAPAQATIDLSTVERLRFIGWIENGGPLGGVSINVLMDRPHELTLSYATQYFVDVRSTYGSVSGSGWYDKGATARIAAPSAAGSWPFTYTLSGWSVDPPSGKLIQGEGSWTLTVDRPYIVDAIWNFDLIPILGLIVGMVVLIAALGGGIALAYKRGMFGRGLTTLRPMKTRVTAAGATRVCSSCGNRFPKTATFCQKCGAPATTPPERSPSEDKVYDYILKHEGVISLSQASRDLEMSVEELKQATERLKKKGRLA